jgi:hypothetical protein
MESFMSKSGKIRRTPAVTKLGILIGPYTFIPDYSNAAIQNAQILFPTLELAELIWMWSSETMASQSKHGQIFSGRNILNHPCGSSTSPTDAQLLFLTLCKNRSDFSSAALLLRPTTFELL